MAKSKNKTASQPNANVQAPPQPVKLSKTQRRKLRQRQANTLVHSTPDVPFQQEDGIVVDTSHVVPRHVSQTAQQSAWPPPGGDLAQPKKRKASQSGVDVPASTTSPPPPPKKQMKMKHPDTVVGNEDRGASVVGSSHVLPLRPSPAVEEAAPRQSDAAKSSDQAAPIYHVHLALAHVLYDTFGSMSWCENYNRVMNGLVERADLNGSLNLPFEALMCAGIMQLSSDEEKKKKVKAMLAQSWLDVILARMGEVAKTAEGVHISLEKVMPNCRLQLTVTPIVGADGPAAAVAVPSVHVDESESDDESDDETATVDRTHGGNNLATNRNVPRYQPQSQPGMIPEIRGSTDPRSLGPSSKTATHAETSRARPAIRVPTGPRGLLSSSNAAGYTEASRPLTDREVHYESRVFPQDVQVSRYPTVPGEPSKHLMLREPVFDGKKNKYIPLNHEDVREVVRQATGGSLILQRRWSVDHYGAGHWIIDLTSSKEAAYLAGSMVKIDGHDLHLTHFQRLYSQVFVCDQVTAALDRNRLLQALEIVFPKQPLFVLETDRSKKTELREKEPNQHHLVVVLKEPDDVERFHYTTETPSELSWNGWHIVFKAAIEGSKCYICGQEHRVYNCQELAPMQLTGTKPKNLLSSLPDIRPANGGS